jgi:hypothetical protein
MTNRDNLPAGIRQSAIFRFTNHLDVLCRHQEKPENLPEQWCDRHNPKP